MPIITISRQLGSQGTEIAQLLSKDLKCEYLDKETLEEKFQEYGIPSESVEHFDERKPGFWDLFKTDKARYLHFMKGVIYEFAHSGNGIILGRGGQFTLGDLRGVLHVRIIAPMATRIQRIAANYECDEKHAERIILHSDHERAGFHKFFFGQSWERDSHYDLVINTGSFPAGTAAKLIIDAAQTEEIKSRREETKHRLTDRCLEQTVKSTLVYEENMGVQFLEVLANNGTVTLRGIVADEDDIKRCNEVLGGQKDIKELRNEIYYKPITTNYGLHY